MSNPPVNFKSTNKNFKFTATIAYSSTCRPNITNPLLKRRPKCKQIANGISTLSQQALRKMGTTITFGSIGQKEKHHWIHYISQTIKSILKLKILKRKRRSKIQQIISLQSESSTQIIDLMASNQSKVALIQKTSNLTNIQYSHHQDNYNYWRIHININIMDYVAKQFLHLKSHHDDSSLQTLWK